MIVLRHTMRDHGGPMGFAAQRALHVAVVHTTEVVRFVTVAPSRSALTEQLAGYVQRHAADQLWPADAECVRERLARRELDAAIEHYFATIGRRWDEERLFIDVIPMDAARDAEPGA
jgi:hypothetical protein